MGKFPIARTIAAVGLISGFTYAALTTHDSLRAPPDFWSLERSKAADAATIERATALNAQLEESFDKSGNWPANVTVDQHSKLLKMLEAIQSNSASYQDAQQYLAKMDARAKKLQREQDERDKLVVARASVLVAQLSKNYDNAGKRPTTAARQLHSDTINALNFISISSSVFSDAQKLREALLKHEAAIRKVERVENVSGRKAFAAELDLSYTKKGFDVQIETVGPKSQSLLFTYILMNRPLAYKMANETDLLKRAWELGFERVTLRNGRSDAWAYHTPKE